jgi:hypothetical protein
MALLAAQVGVVAAHNIKAAVVVVLVQLAMPQSKMMQDKLVMVE